MANESGYFVVLKGFVRINPRDIDGHGRVIEAIKKARAGDAADLLAVVSIDDLKVQSVTRRARPAPEQAALPVGDAP